MQVTLLIYMASDNDLARYAEQDLERIIESSYSSDMRVIVQYKQSFVNNPALRVVIKNGELVDEEDLGQINMANPKVLNSFIEASAKTYPTDKFIVILWSHGSGIDDRDIYDKEKKRKLYFVPEKEIEEIAFGFDDSYQDFLDNLELQKALDVSVTIDVLGFDACFMGMFEIIYQLKNQAEVVVASQYLEPALGWDYSRILEELNQSGTSIDIGKQLISFHDEYHDAKERAEVTQSALDTSMIEKASIKLDKFSKLLRAELKKNDTVKNKKELRITLENCQFFGRTDYVDLIDFVDKVKSRLKFEVLEPHADELLDSLKELIIANHSIGYFMDDANGISVYFPYEPRPCEETFLMYEKLDFSLEYPNWIRLLKWYWLKN